VICALLMPAPKANMHSAQHQSALGFASRVSF
jgi:hypothetical protein